jgi:hypothetical protein
MHRVLEGLAQTPASGYAQNLPSCRLTGPQADLQLRLYTRLRALGLDLHEQGNVYGWLLDQIAAHLA